MLFAINVTNLTSILVLKKFLNNAIVQVNHSKSQPGNANAPSSTFVPGRKGPGSTSRKNTVILVLLRDKTHDSTTETSTIEEDNYFDNHQSESKLSLSILITFSMFLQ